MIVRFYFERVMFYHDKNIMINLSFEIIWFFWLASFLFCLYLKSACVNANFIFVSKIWKAQEKKIINCSCPKHHKIINCSKNSHKCLFSQFLWFLFEARKRSVKIKKIFHFSALFEIGKAGTVFVELLSYTMAISLAMEIHKTKTWNMKIKLFC